MVQRYKYQVEDKSLTQPFLARYVWKPIADKLPHQLSPNVITLIGGATVFFSIPFIWLAFQGKGWGFLAAAFCIMLYLTADNIDGLHARNTGQSSKKGEFLDHWLDSITTLIISLSILFALEINGWLLATILISIATAFFATNWEYRHTGVFYTEHVGTNEGLLIVIFLYLILFFFFKTPFFTYQGPTTLNAASSILYFSIFGCSVTIFKSILRMKKHLFEFIPFLFTMSVIAAWGLTDLISNFIMGVLILGGGVPFCGSFLLRRLCNLKSIYRNWISLGLGSLGWVLFFLKESVDPVTVQYVTYMTLFLIFLSLLRDLFRALTILASKQNLKA